MTSGATVKHTQNYSCPILNFSVHRTTDQQLLYLYKETLSEFFYEVIIIKDK